MPNAQTFVATWRYYHDGKSWLLNVSQKKKTVFWLSVISGSFRITAYFTDKAKDAVRASRLSDELKEQFLGRASTGKLRASRLPSGRRGTSKTRRSSSR